GAKQGGVVVLRFTSSSGSTPLPVNQVIEAEFADDLPATQNIVKLQRSTNPYITTAWEDVAIDVVRVRTHVYRLVPKAPLLPSSYYAARFSASVSARGDNGGVIFAPSFFVSTGPSTSSDKADFVNVSPYSGATGTPRNGRIDMLLSRDPNVLSATSE